MEKTKIQQLKEHYLALRQNILNTILKFNNETDCEGDDIDAVQAKTISDLADKLSQRQFIMLKKLDISLAKIADGSFGECEECGNDIGFKRLEAIPGVDCCINCAEKRESQIKSFVV